MLPTIDHVGKHFLAMTTFSSLLPLGACPHGSHSNGPRTGFSNNFYSPLSLDYIPRTAFCPHPCLFFALKIYCLYFPDLIPPTFCDFLPILSPFPFTLQTSAFPSIIIGWPGSPSTWNPICSQILGASPHMNSKNVSY